MKFKPIYQSAFTLLELLVVIGIISILVSLGAISYSTAQKKARDAKRKSDVKAIQSSLEQYYSVCGYQYPTPASDTFTNITCLTPPAAIMPTVPTDPRGATTPYPCPTASCNSSGYKICTYSLEAQSPTGYCLQNQQ